MVNDASAPVQPPAPPGTDAGLLVAARPLGGAALLLDVVPGGVGELLRRLGATPPSGVIDLVPAARTLLVQVDPRALPLARAERWVRTAAASVTPPEDERDEAAIDLDVVYDGEDLAETARLLDMSAEALVARHRDARWWVAFTGFAPGFGYLESPDWPFDVPRLATPRTRVPAGAVGLAAGFTGAYPRATPGGWRLIGRTAAVLFDPLADPPALLAPGRRVRFREVEALPVVRAAAPQAGEARAAGAGIRVERAGILSTIQDAGRPSRASIGVSPSGAADRGALHLANRLLGNPAAAAGVEVTLGGFRAVAERDAWVAVTGAGGALSIDGHACDPAAAHAWPAGTTLEIAPLTSGVRAYLAVRGGIEAPRVLGSSATDTLSGLGPAVLADGDVLAIGAEPEAPIPVGEVIPFDARGGDDLVVEVHPGPRADWFTAAARDALYAEVFTVTADADRVGIRLVGPDLARAVAGELPSEPMVPGALQVPPGGRVVVLGRDGPVTGGYPVIAVATDAALDALGQARPGTRVRFRHARGG